MNSYQLKPLKSNGVKNGECLLQLNDFQDKNISQLPEGTPFIVISDQNKPLGQALKGNQNKGVAWLWTRNIKDTWSEEFVSEKLKVAYEKREKLKANPNTTAYRIFNGEGDGLGGITIDLYNRFIVIDWYTQGLYQYKEWVYHWLQQLNRVDGIYETLRFKTDLAKHRLVWGIPSPEPLVIYESKRAYAVHLGQDWMTGLFLDQREVRDFINQQAYGRMLNLFSYTGAFSIAAALNGADTVSVDVANRSDRLTRQNFELNQINPDNKHHEIRVMDVFDYLNYAQRHDLQFDLIVCDPPSFARTKKRQFQVIRDYKDLAKQVFSITKPAGMTILSLNHSGYLADEFRTDMLEASQEVIGNYHLIQTFSLSEDFPTSADSESNYLKVLVFYREA